MTADAVVLDDVQRRAGRAHRLVRGLVRRPARGAVVIVIGPNGSGKTTLLQLLLGLLRRRRGEVTVLGATPTAGRPADRLRAAELHGRVGDAIRCRDLVTLGITGRRGGSAAQSRDERGRVDEALDRVGAREHRTNRRLSELSGGQQQRVAIAQALVGRPGAPAARRAARQPRRAQPAGDRRRCSSAAARHDATVTIFVVAHDLNPLLSVLDRRRLPARRPRPLRHRSAMSSTRTC